MSADNTWFTPERIRATQRAARQMTQSAGQQQAITATTFPPQGPCLHARVAVSFSGAPSESVLGTIVRDDAAWPFELLIRLDDGRYVRGVECLYHPLDAGVAAAAAARGL